LRKINAFFFFLIATFAREKTKVFSLSNYKTIIKREKIIYSRIIKQY